MIDQIPSRRVGLLIVTSRFLDFRTDHLPVAAIVLMEWANECLAKLQRLSDVVVNPADFARNTLGKGLQNNLGEAYSLQARANSHD